MFALTYWFVSMNRGRILQGNIEKRTNKSGSISYRLTVSTGEKLSNGKYKRVRETISGTKKQANDRLRTMIHEIETGNYRSRREPQTITELMGDWIEASQVRSRMSGTPRQHTVDSYKWISNRYVVPLIGDENAITLKPIDVQRFHEKLSKLTGRTGEPLSARTLKHAHSVLSMALRYAMRLGYRTSNPADLVGAIPKQHVPVEVINPIEAEKVFEKLEENSPLCAVAAKLALTTGARRSEICALNWGDIDLVGQTIQISKAFIESNDGPVMVDAKTVKSRRSASMPPTTVERLTRWRSESESIYRTLGVPLSDRSPVFRTATGRLHPQSLSRSWRRACKRVGLKIKFHALRHSFATTAIEAGVPLAFVSNQLGHSSVAITADVYGHVAQGFGQQAAAAVGAAFSGAIAGDNKGIQK